MNEERRPSLFLQRTAGAAIALLFGIGTLMLTLDVRRADQLIPICPFGWYRMIVIHAVAALPLAWLIGSIVPKNRLIALVAVATGVAIALATVRFGRNMGWVVYWCDCGFFTRHLVRVFWCVALEAPWFALFAGGFDKERVSWNAAALAAVIAFFPPAFYAQRLCETRTEAATDAWRQWRFLKARDEVWRLADVGSRFPLGEEKDDSGETIDVAPRTALARLDSNVLDLRKEVVRLHSNPRLPKADRLQLADHLIALDAWYLAKRVIGELAEEDVTASLRLAQVLQREEAWEPSTEEFRRAMTLVPESGEETAGLKAYIYDCLAYNARECKRPDEAEAFYREALDELPAFQAHFHNQLGRHFELLGRVREAEREFQIAHELDGDQFPESAGLLHRILSNGTPVGIFAPEASNYR